MNNKNMHGFTLIELMVGMVLSLFLVSGIISIYMSSKAGYQVREQLSMLEDNGRIALQTMINHIAHSGYAGPQHLGMPEYVLDPAKTIADGICGDGASNITNKAILQNTQEGNSGVSDQIAIAYMADDLNDNRLIRDCSGNVIRDACRLGQAANIEGTYIYNSFFIDHTTAEEPQLFCAGSVGDEPVLLAEGVEDMQVLYGVDLTGDRLHDRLMTADQVGGQWGNVVMVKVAILVRTLDARNRQVMSQHFQLLNETRTFSDRYQRAVFSADIILRNVLL